MSFNQLLHKTEFVFPTGIFTLMGLYFLMLMLLKLLLYRASHHLQALWSMFLNTATIWLLSSIFLTIGLSAQMFPLSPLGHFQSLLIFPFSIFMLHIRLCCLQAKVLKHSQYRHIQPISCPPLSSTEGLLPLELSAPTVILPSPSTAIPVKVCGKAKLRLIRDKHLVLSVPLEIWYVT